MAEETGLAIQKIRDQIVRLEGRPPVMLVEDLAEIYQVKPDLISQAVRRHPERFPEDFVFRLTVEEWEKCSLQFEGSVPVKAFAPHNAPLAFTREGANQLSSCLKSKIAAERSIQIMRAFSAIEERAQKFQDSGDILLDSLKGMVQLRERQIQMAKAIENHDQALADQGRKIKAIAATQDEELELTAEQEKNLNALMERLISARVFARKLPAGDVAPALWNWIKRRLGIRTFKSVSRANYPLAIEVLKTQIAREEAEAGQASLKLVKPRHIKKNKISEEAIST